MGMKAVEVMRNDVESQEAESEEWNSEVMTGWLDAMRVASKLAMNSFQQMQAKMNQKVQELCLNRLEHGKVFISVTSTLTSSAYFGRNTSYPNVVSGSALGESRVP